MRQSLPDNSTARGWQDAAAQSKTSAQRAPSDFQSTESAQSADDVSTTSGGNTSESDGSSALELPKVLRWDEESGQWVPHHFPELDDEEVPSESDMSLCRRDEPESLPQVDPHAAALVMKAVHGSSIHGCFRDSSDPAGVRAAITAARPQRLSSGAAEFVPGSGSYGGPYPDGRSSVRSGVLASVPMRTPLRSQAAAFTPLCAPSLWALPGARRGVPRDQLQVT